MKRNPLLVTMAFVGVFAIAIGAYRCRASLKFKETIAIGDAATDAAADAAGDGDVSDASDAAASSIATILNDTKTDVTVFVAFGSNSVIVPTQWSSFCNHAAALTCSFFLPAGGERDLPLGGAYLNATFSFGGPVGCGVTKAELNINNPSWYDVVDVSLVDGYSNKVAIYATTRNGDAETTTKLGPPNGKAGNEKVLGLFPLGCDVCVDRQNPPCGIAKGKAGCKAGSQFKPDVPCQWQGATMGGGSTIVVSYLGSN